MTCVVARIECCYMKAAELAGGDRILIGTVAVYGQLRLLREFSLLATAHHIIRIGGNDSEVVSSSVFATALVVRPFVGSDSVGRKILVVRRAVLAASGLYILTRSVRPAGPAHFPRVGLQWLAPPWPVAGFTGCGVARPSDTALH